MKTTIVLPATLVFIIVFFTHRLPAQTQPVQLVGLTSYGGANNSGTIVKMNSDGTGLTKIYDFAESTGWLPVGDLLQRPDGRLYGVCNEGGVDNSCVLFSFDPATGAYDSLFNYYEYTGDVPFSSLIPLPDGRLCGVATDGGVYNDGVIYAFDPTHLAYTDLYAFGADSASSLNGPFGAPLLSADGNLYGMTTSTRWAQVGDSFVYSNGLIYSYNISTGVYTDLYDFTGSNDGNGYGSLVQLANGKLYGMTSGDPYYWFGDGPAAYSFNAPGSYGNVFSFDPVSKTYTSLVNFNGTNGAAPFGSLLYASDGKLYGLTSQGGGYNYGTLFSLDPVTNTFTHLFDFDSVIAGANPSGGLMQSTDGNLYGSTFAGGASGVGTYFRFNPTSLQFTVINSLDGNTGANPMGGSLAFYSPARDTQPAHYNVAFNIFPVPTDNSTTVQLVVEANALATMKLFDEAGNIVWSQQQQLIAGVNYTSIDVNLMAAGEYFLQVDANGQKMTGKVMVQR